MIDATLRVAVDRLALGMEHPRDDRAGLIGARKGNAVSQSP
jgi:hypothetical protein